MSHNLLTLSHNLIFYKILNQETKSTESDKQTRTSSCMIEKKFRPFFKQSDLTKIYNLVIMKVFSTPTWILSLIHKTLAKSKLKTYNFVTKVNNSSDIIYKLLKYQNTMMYYITFVLVMFSISLLVSDFKNGERAQWQFPASFERNTNLKRMF